MQNDFAILGVSPDVDEAALKQARNRLVKKYHPDRCGGDPSAAAKLIEVNAAYERVRKLRQAYGWQAASQKQESARKATEKPSGWSASKPSDKKDRTKGIWPEFNEAHPFFGWGSAQDFDPEIARQAEQERELKAKLKKAEEERARRQEEARKAAEAERIAAEAAERDRAQREARERQQSMVSHSLVVTEPLRRMLEEQKHQDERKHTFSAATQQSGRFAASSMGFGFDPSGGFFSAGHIPESVMICGKNVLVYLPDDPSCRVGDFLLMPDIEFPEDGPPRFAEHAITLKFDAHQEVGGWTQLTCVTNGLSGELKGRHIQVCQRAAFAQAG